MSSETVLWEQTGGVGRITLNRPDSLNAWTAEFGTALRDIIDGEAADPSVRAVLITGGPRLLERGRPEGGLRGPQRGRHARRALTELDDLPPAIAASGGCRSRVVRAVNGPAVGIGCSLAPPAT